MKPRRVVYIICLVLKVIPEMEQPVQVTVEKTPEPVATEQKPADQSNVTVSDVPAKDSAPVAKWENPSSFEGASFASTVVNIVNTVIGAGVLSIAFSIRQAGILGSIILIILILIPSYITTYYLASATVYTNESIYGRVGEKLLNKTIGALSDFTLVLLDFGIDIAYMNVLFKQIVDICTELFSIGDFMNKYKTVIPLSCFHI